MFIIVDNTKRMKLRNDIVMSLNESKLPFVLTDSDHADLYMPCALIVVTEKYLLKDMKYISDLNGKTPVVAWDETNIVEFVKKAYFEIYGRVIFEFCKNNVIYDGNNVRFYSRNVNLTSTEKKIVCFLLYCDGWHQKDQIAKFCLKKGIKAVDSVPVHICNINQKTRRLINNDIIEYKRYSGYTIS